MSSTNPLGTALITGASSGIGAVYADRLAGRGHDLVLVARSADKLQTVATRIAARSGRRVEVLVADLATLHDQQRVAERLRSDDGIGVLVNNAGFNLASPIVDSSPERLDEMIQLNVVALTRLARAVAPRLAQRGRGAIINISSIAAIAPTLLNGTYGGTKAYVLNFTQALQHELGAKGVRVQAVLPGATRTDFWALAGLPVEHLPTEIVMSAEDMVDASLVAFDQGEVVTIPALPDLALWKSFEAAQAALGPFLSSRKPAARLVA
jgi:short-subunit dehydrogenase